MGIAESWSAWRRGEGWNNAFGYLYLSQDDIDAGKAAESRLDALNRDQFDAGRISDQEYTDRQSRINSSSITSMLENPETSPWSGFKEGLAEGADNVQSTIKGAIAAPINFTLGAIPWQVWLIAGVFLAWKAGLIKVGK